MTDSRAELADELATQAATYAAGTPTRKLLHKAADALRASSAPAEPDEEFFRDDPMFNKGVEHVVDMMARELDVHDWSSGDGSEDYDTDLWHTIQNILAAKGLYDDETGEYVKAAQPVAVSDLSRACSEPSRFWLDIEDELAWTILQALHSNVPEVDRPQSWSDLKDEQATRVRNAARMASTLIALRQADQAEAAHTPSETVAEDVFFKPRGNGVTTFTGPSDPNERRRAREADRLGIITTGLVAALEAQMESTILLLSKYEYSQQEIEDCTSQARAALNAARERKPFKMEVSKEWCMNMARLEAKAGDPDCTTFTPQPDLDRLRQYAKDLRRNSCGGDFTEVERAVQISVADYIDLCLGDEK